ncbi:hypothetical protein ACHAPT_011672 [Fusarium lateritium]
MSKINASPDLEKCRQASKKDGDRKSCEKHREDYSAILYTRGEPIPGSEKHARGTFQAVPPELSCIYDQSMKLGIPEKSNWSKEERIRHFADQSHVYDHFGGDDHFNRLFEYAKKLTADMDAQVSHELNKSKGPEAADAAIEKLSMHLTKDNPLLSSELLERIPFSVDLYGGPEGPNAQAWKRRFEPDDRLLECQHIRHLVIRMGDRPLDWKVADSVRFNLSLFPRLELGDVDRLILNRFCRDRNALLDIEWSLLTNLESLCLDLHGIYEDESNSLESLFVNMGKHLHLKSLKLIDVPYPVNFDVAKQEDDKVLIVPGDEDESPFEFPNYIYFLKECLAPGGKLCLVTPKPRTWK